MPTDLNALLSAMQANQASDLFLVEGKVPAARVHGVVRTVAGMAPTTEEDLLALLSPALTPARRAALDQSGDLDVGLTLGDGHRYRLNLGRQQGRLAVVARRVPSGEQDLSTLGLPDQARRFAELGRGLVLVVGATGSGKSTTLAAMVHHINRTRRVHIVTIEDPIEFVHKDLRARVSQREVGGDTHDFPTALRHVVRQSPDVIVIGELRDSESVRVAISAALTGHLVLGSFHTSDSVQTIQRLLATFPEHQRAQAAVDLALCLGGVVAQRLVPALSGGRVLAAEVLTISPAAAKLLREQRIEELGDLMRSDKSREMQTFNTHLLSLLAAGRIDLDTGLAFSTNPDEFALFAKGISTGTDMFRREEAGSVGGWDMQELLRQAMSRGASDLHLTSGRRPILRITGDLVQLGAAALTPADMRMLLFSIMSGRQRTNFEIDREVDFALALNEGQRFRVNAYYQKGQMAAALRAIPSKPPAAESLALPEQVLALGDRPHGLVLVVGPTGAGKSTTLACLIDRINHRRACRIITIEDPIEYTHEGDVATIDQREVYADTKSFAAALKYILRQDPDVILVGEMRDFETISSALTAAETGHLVFATLHTNDAIQTIDRIIDVFPPHQQSQARSQLSNGLLGVISQRLLPRASGEGRVAAFEVMMATSGIRALIRDNKMHQAQSLMETSRREGCVTMDRAVLDLYRAGLVGLEDATRYVKDPRILLPPSS